MNKIFCAAYMLMVLAFMTFSDSKAQNCVGIQNLDILNVAKQIKPEKLKYVTTVRGKLNAAPGFKQLRDTETFLLVPEEFQGRIGDLVAFLPESNQGRFVLDTGRMTARLVCQTGADLQRHCKHIRQGKQIIGCSNCADATWVSASVLSEIGVIIPPYRSK